MDRHRRSLASQRCGSDAKIEPKRDAALQPKLGVVPPSGRAHAVRTSHEAAMGAPEAGGPSVNAGARAAGGGEVQAKSRRSSREVMLFPLHEAEIAQVDQQ